MRKHVEESAATGAAAWRGRGGRFSAGEQHAVAVAGVRHVTPFKRAHFRPPQPAHEQQRGDHGVESAPAVRRGGGFDAPAVRAGTGGGGENRGEPVRAQRGGLAPAPVGGRATEAAQHAGGRFPGGGRLAGERGPKPDGGDGEGGGGGRADPPRRSRRGRRPARRRQPGRPRARRRSAAARRRRPRLVLTLAVLTRAGRRRAAP